MGRRLDSVCLCICACPAVYRARYNSKRPILPWSDCSARESTLILSMLSYLSTISPNCRYSSRRSVCTLTNEGRLRLGCKGPSVRSNQRRWSLARFSCCGQRDGNLTDQLRPLRATVSDDKRLLIDSVTNYRWCSLSQGSYIDFKQPASARQKDFNGASSFVSITYDADSISSAFL